MCQGMGIECWRTGCYETAAYRSRGPHEHPSAILPHTEKVIPDFLAPHHLFPSETGDVDDAHAARAVPSALGEVAPELVLVDVLGPVVRPPGHDPEKVLGHEIGRKPAHPRPSNSAQNEPTAWLHKCAAAVEEGGGRRDVLEHLEERHDIVLVVFGRGVR